MLKRSTPVLLVICAAAALAGLAGAAPALGNTPAWLVTSDVRPMVLAPGGTGEILLRAENVGDASTNGSPIVVTDNLPKGLKVTGTYPGYCKVTPSSISCEYENMVIAPYGSIARGDEIELPIKVSVEEASPGAVNVASISGGGAERESNSEAVRFGSAPDNGFGVEKLEQVALNENGSPDTQAGSHPFQYVTTLELNTHSHKISPISEPLFVLSGAFPKDLNFNLPPGMIGNPTVVPQCTNRLFSAQVEGAITGVNECPDDTVVGVARIRLQFTATSLPLFNLVPHVGEPARFGFDYLGIPIFLDTAVRSGGDYGVVVKVSNISDIEEFKASQVSFWGVPSDPRHDSARGWKCVDNGVYAFASCPSSPPGTKPGAPFLTLPTSCTGPLRSYVEADAWGSTHEVGPHERPGEFQTTEYTWHNAQGPIGLDGCNHLPFDPSIAVTPDGQTRARRRGWRSVSTCRRRTR